MQIILVNNHGNKLVDEYKTDDHSRYGNHHVIGQGFYHVKNTGVPSAGSFADLPCNRAYLVINIGKHGFKVGHKHHAQRKYRPVRRSADGEVGHSTGECGEGHNKHAGANGGLQLIPQHGGEDQQHHHAAAGPDEAADEADDHAAHHRLHRPLLGADALHGLLGGHHRPDDELHTQQEGHYHGEAPHGGRGDDAGDVAAHHGKGQHTGHHNKPIANVQIFVLPVGIGGYGAGQHVRGQGDAHRQIRVHAQKGDEHGADDGGGAHPGEAGAKTGPHPGEKADENSNKNVHGNLPNCETYKRYAPL